MPQGIELSSPPEVFPVAGYEHVARAGDFIFVAGQVARDAGGVLVGPGDAAAQAEQIYRNIGAILRHVGATAEHVVKINTILVDRDDSASVTAARKVFFGSHRPPHTGVIVAGLGSPQVRVEVEVIAYLQQGTGS